MKKNIENPEIADQNEVLTYLTTVMRSETDKTTERIKAAQFLFIHNTQSEKLTKSGWFKISTDL